MTARRLLDNHPTSKKVQQVFDLMDKLGLRFTAESHGRGLFFIVEDRDFAFPDPLELVDLDDPNDASLSTLPPTFDYKLRYGHK